MRLRERKISKSSVKKAILNFNRIVNLGDNKFMCYYKINGFNLVVVFAKQKDITKVITTYYENNL